MSFGVPAGAATAVQVAPSTSGKPASAMVGTSGSVGARVLPVTASARSRPDLISGTAGASAPNEIGVWPPTVASTAGAAAAERHMHEIEIQRMLEQRADKLRRRAGAGRA